MADRAETIEGTRHFEWRGPVVHEEKGAKYYQSVDITDRRGGVRYSVGDNIYFQALSSAVLPSPPSSSASSSSSSRVHVGEVKCFYERESDQEKLVEIRWYFRPSQVREREGDCLADTECDDAKDVFLSDECDVQSLPAIISKCQIKYVALEDESDFTDTGSNGSNSSHSKSFKYKYDSNRRETDRDGQQLLCRYYYNCETQQQGRDYATVSRLRWSHDRSRVRSSDSVSPTDSAGSNSSSSSRDTADALDSDKRQTETAERKKVKKREDKSVNAVHQNGDAEGQQGSVGCIEDKSHAPDYTSEEGETAKERMENFAFRLLCEEIRPQVLLLLQGESEQRMSVVLREVWDDLAADSKAAYISKAERAQLAGHRDWTHGQTDSTAARRSEVQEKGKEKGKEKGHEKGKEKGLEEEGGKLFDDAARAREKQKKAKEKRKEKRKEANLTGLKRKREQADLDGSNGEGLDMMGIEGSSNSPVPPPLSSPSGTSTTAINGIDDRTITGEYPAPGEDVPSSVTKRSQALTIAENSRKIEKFFRRDRFSEGQEEGQGEGEVDTTHTQHPANPSKPPYSSPVRAKVSTPVKSPSHSHSLFLTSPATPLPSKNVRIGSSYQVDLRYLWNREPREGEEEGEGEGEYEGYGHTGMEAGHCVGYQNGIGSGISSGSHNGTIVRAAASTEYRNMIRREGLVWTAHSEAYIGLQSSSNQSSSSSSSSTGKNSTMCYESHQIQEERNENAIQRYVVRAFEIIETHRKLHLLRGRIAGHESSLRPREEEEEGEGECTPTCEGKEEQGPSGRMGVYPQGGSRVFLRATALEHILETLHSRGYCCSAALDALQGELLTPPPCPCPSSSSPLSTSTLPSCAPHFQGLPAHAPSLPPSALLVEWRGWELQQVQAAFAKFGDNLSFLIASVPSKTPSEVTEYYFHSIYSAVQADV